MKLKIKPQYKDSCFIDTDEPFAKSLDYDITRNATYSFKVGFNLYLIDEEGDEEDIVATVEGVFF